MRTQSLGFCDTLAGNEAHEGTCIFVKWKLMETCLITESSLLKITAKKSCEIVIFFCATTPGKEPIHLHPGVWRYFKAASNTCKRSASSTRTHTHVCVYIYIYTYVRVTVYPYVHVFVCAKIHSHVYVKMYGCLICFSWCNAERRVSIAH